MYRRNWRKKREGDGVELAVKRFDELSARELYEIYALRVAVFVVEQNCAYQEVDALDLCALHVYLTDEKGICAYCRVMPENTMLKDVAIGRVIARDRGCGLGRKIVEAGIKAAQENFSARVIAIEAQTYARVFYEKLGFVCTGEEFVEDGIAHIPMRREEEF